MSPIEVFEVSGFIYTMIICNFRGFHVRFKKDFLLDLNKIQLLNCNEKKLEKGKNISVLFII
jgi:hypothetical protein